MRRQRSTGTTSVRKYLSTAVSTGFVKAGEVWLVTDLSRTHSQGTDSVLRNQFEGLADRWEKETAHLSSISRRRNHVYFSRLTKIGPRAIPWALERIRTSNPFWFLVLKEIVPSGPTERCNGDAEAVRAKWLAWGKMHGHVA